MSTIRKFKVTVSVCEILPTDSIGLERAAFLGSSNNYVMFDERGFKGNVYASDADAAKESAILKQFELWLAETIIKRLG
jgi:hypothetical protein